MNKFLLLFIISYNPILIYLLMEQGGIGIMTIRLGLVFLSLFIMIYVFACSVIYYKQYKIKVPDISFNSLLMSIFLFFFIVSALVGIIKNQFLKFYILDFVFFGELFLGYYIIKFSNFSETLVENKVSTLGNYLFFMSACSLTAYWYLTFYAVGVDFGALKVYVDGIVLNRLVDFIIPIFTAPIIFYIGFSKNKILHILFILLVIVLCFLTFYRTVYLAVAVGFIVFIVQSFSIKKLLLSFLLLSLIASFLALFETEFINAITARIISIFETETSTSMSRSIRLEQLKMFYYIFDFFPLGFGLGGYIDDYIISTGNNITSLFLIFGPIGGLIFLFLISKVLLDSLIMTKRETNIKHSYIITSCSSIILSCLIVLFLFPYKYFAIYLIIGVMIGILDQYSLKKKYLISLHKNSTNSD